MTLHVRLTGLAGIIFATVVLPEAGLSQAQPPAPPRCTTPAHRAFDFWLGAWEVADTAGRLVGTNTITASNGGCTLHESWVGRGGVRGQSVNAFDRATGQWHQTWSDASGLVLRLAGGSEADGVMRLEGDRTLANGGTVRERITWTRLEDDRVRQHWVRSTDGGLTWTTSFDGYYTRVIPACHQRGTQLLILGTYHFANPGLDAVRTEVDDVLSEARQRQIAELVDRMVGFAPTKVAIEGQFGRSTWPDRYREWREARTPLTRNEIEQIGFRVADRLDHATVYPVDYQMFMSGQNYDELDFDVQREDAARRDSVGQAAGRAPPPPSPTERRIRESTILEYLRWINADLPAIRDHAGYMDMLRPPRSVSRYQRTDAVTNWYKRNLRILTNVNRIATPDGSDRILLIMGSGHLQILRELAAASRHLCLVDPMEYLR